MSCFWLGVEKGVRKLIPGSARRRPEEMARFVQSKNKKTEDVMVNGVLLTPKEIEENFEHCREYDLSTVNNGYDCSTSDPFLCLVASLYNVNIVHNYMNVKISYSVPTPSTTVRFHSNRGHFWH